MSRHQRSISPVLALLTLVAAAAWAFARMAA